MSNVRSFISSCGTRYALARPGPATLAKLAASALVLLPLPGCQSITGSPQLSQVRIIDASPDAPGLDVYQGSSALAYNLGLGTVTSYVPIAPGGSTLLVDSAGTRQTLISASGTFAVNSQYTVLVGNFAANLQELILKDQAIPAPAGDIALRFIDQSTRAGAVDLYLVPSGSALTDVSPTLTNIGFNTNTGYLTVPAGTFTLVALPTGTVPTAKIATLYTGAAVVYSAGSVATLIMIDAATSTPTIRVVTANDYEPL